VARGSSTSVWTNWSRIQRCEPDEVVHPSSEDELAAAVGTATERGGRVKIPGAGHSFTGCALTDDVHIRLDRYRNVLGVDRDTNRVTVEAGIHLYELNEALAGMGLAMHNLGDVDRQTIAGAVSTGTHGTGSKLGNLSTAVVGARVVAADGTVIDCDAERDADVFEAARLGIGAAGMLSTLTLQCVPAYNLRALEQKEHLDDLLERLDEEADGNDHFEFHWFPHTPYAWTKRNNRTDEPARVPNKRKQLMNEIVLENVVLGAVWKLGRRFPSQIPRLADFTTGQMGRSDYVGRSDRVFVTRRLVHFNEMEYAIPRTEAASAISAVRQLIDRSGLKVNVPIEVRFVAADDLWLSPAHGRDTCYIAVHLFWGMPVEQYFCGVETIMRERGGRPHWGKLHFRTASDLAPSYPMWDAFAAARRKVDPTGTFTNAYTDRVLGPVA